MNIDVLGNSNFLTEVLFCTAEVSLRGGGSAQERLMVLYKTTDIVQALPRPQRMLPAASSVSMLISFKN